MKANEAKSKFVYPDKLYARCKDNKTLDISYAPQNMEAVEYIRTDVFIEKTCQWLYDNLHWADPSDFLEDFKTSLQYDYNLYF